MSKRSEAAGRDLLVKLGSISIHSAVPNIAHELSAATGIDIDSCKAMIVSLRKAAPGTGLSIDQPTN